MKKIALTLIAVLTCSFCLTGTAVADDKLVSLIDQMADYQVTEECASALGLSAGTVGFSLLEAVVDPDATQGCQTRSPVGPFVREEDCQASQASASDPKTGCYYQDGKYYYDVILTVACDETNPDEVPPTPTDGFF